MTATPPLAACLVTDDPQVELAVRRAVGPDARLDVFSSAGLEDERRSLSAHGHRIAAAAGQAGVLLLEWVMERAPELNTLCFHVRADLHGPIIMLCSGGATDRSASIAAGGDDALTFPISSQEVQATILSYRRLVDLARGSRSALEQASARTVGALRLDPVAHRFYIRDEEVELTPREFRLLQYLIENEGELRTRDQILDEVWGIQFDTGTNMVDVYMYFLRRKLEAYGLKNMIETVRGFGYRLVHGV